MLPCEIQTTLLHVLCRQADGTLTKTQPSHLDLLSLVQPGRAASLLFVVNAPSGMLAGEAVFDVVQLSALDTRIKRTVQQVWLGSPICCMRL